MKSAPAVRFCSSIRLSWHAGLMSHSLPFVVPKTALVPLAYPLRRSRTPEEKEAPFRDIMEIAHRSAKLAAENPALPRMTCMTSPDCRRDRDRHFAGDDWAWPAGARPPTGALVARKAIEIIPFDGELAHESRATFVRFGKGRHPANLNFGDACPMRWHRPAGCRYCTRATISRGRMS